ncbi:MAG TPA: pseudouridine synthase [Thermomicrobiales bacterium]|nr:pseudouridine synthase [Thermomicrobiales bacterium]
MERLQRILASRGVASRRVAETMIAEGRVSVNGQIVIEPGTKADPEHDEIRVDGNIVKQQALRYIMLNKPTGYITTTSDERDRWTVMDLLRVPERVFPVGRLDRDTEGLLLLTNDGDVAHRIMHPRFGLAKEYHVLTGARPNPMQLQRIREGVLIERRRVVPEEIRLHRETQDGTVLTITVHEGINHLVRRIMEVAGIQVVRLRRVRVGLVELSGLRLGEWRDLTAGEVGSLTQALRMSDDQVARQANRPVRSTQGGVQSPANPLWQRPTPRQKSLKPGQRRSDFEKTEEAVPRAARETNTEQPETEESGKHERRERPTRGGGQSRRPERDRNRRSGGVRKNNNRRTSR